MNFKDKQNLWQKLSTSIYLQVIRLHAAHEVRVRGVERVNELVELRLELAAECDLRSTSLAASPASLRRGRSWLFGWKHACATHSREAEVQQGGDERGVRWINGKRKQGSWVGEMMMRWEEEYCNDGQVHGK